MAGATEAVGPQPPEAQAEARVLEALPIEVAHRRLVMAMAEACGEAGFAATSVAALVERAGVERAAFDRLFGSKEECLLASYNEIAERMCACASAAWEAGRDWRLNVKAAVAAALRELDGHPGWARLLMVEIDAAGVEGLARKNASIDRISRVLHRIHKRDVGPSRSATTDWAIVASAMVFLAEHVATGEAGRLAELEEDLLQLIFAA